jgi:hypothetical protein
MQVQKDFKELLGLFNVHHVDFMVVGGYALAHHGSPRFTGDLDLYVHPTHENAGKILAALKDFGFGALGLSLEDFQNPDNIVQLGVPPVRVDLITSIDGVSWEEAWQGKDEGHYGGVPVFFLGRKEFISNKRAGGRHKDLADIDALGE